MRLMRSSNPVFRRLNSSNADFVVEGGATASYLGVGLKTFYFIFISILSAFGGIALLKSKSDLLVPLVIGAAISTFIFSLISFFFPKASPYTGTLYCLAEGFLLGIITYILEIYAKGIGITAALTTLAVVVVVSVMYMTKIVKVTNRFVKFVVILSFTILLGMLFTFIYSLITGRSFSEVFGDSPLISIGVSVLVALLAALYLFLDLEYIKETVETGAPKYLEWYAAFGFVFTIIWLYVRILDILVKIKSYSK